MPAIIGAMQRLPALLLFATSLTAFAAPPPDEDRRAILSMAGSFNVIFDFNESVVLAPGYTATSKPYHEQAFETVIVAEDTPERITLQHLLVVSEDGKSHIIKHWAQIWTWQDTRILDYAGHETWTRNTVAPEQAAGKWSQLVTSIDDTPRYESLGRWTHELGTSSWTSEPTRRPLPRREYEQRDDYDYLLGTNRHTLTANGWVHWQDNRKIVDRDGKKFALSFETGLNQYVRAENPLAAEATTWWEKNSALWNPVRDFWLAAGEKNSGPTFAYTTSHESVTLSATFKELKKSAPTAEQISAALTPYITTP
jgi:hypothetical protein